MKLFVVFLYLCTSSAVYGDSRSSSSSGSYTTPRCQASNGFYCPLTQSCISRDRRCTGDNSAPACEKKTYNCDYDSFSGEFEVYRHSTPLASFGSSSRTNLLNCIGRELAHQFITYRGLMYEFGDYGSRVQDPLDPNYEYNTRRITKTVYVGTSTCTYQEVTKFLRIWVDYDLCSHNCQDFAKGLGKYLTDDCTSLRKRSPQSDDDFAQYIFGIAGDGNCTTTLSTSGSPAATSLQFVSIATAIIIGTLTIVF